MRADYDDRRRDYGPQGACAPKAFVLALLPLLLLRWCVRKARRK